MRAEKISGKGFSLVETLITVAVMSILLGLATHEFGKWIVKSDIESQVAELHGRLQAMRAEANFRNRAHFLRLETGGYSVAADTWPEAFGNGRLDDEDSEIVPYKEFRRPANGGSVIKIDHRGFIPLNTARTICFYSDVNPATDCIVIHCARTNTGKIRNQRAACNAENCRVK